MPCDSPCVAPAALLVQLGTLSLLTSTTRHRNSLGMKFAAMKWRLTKALTTAGNKFALSLFTVLWKKGEFWSALSLCAVMGVRGPEWHLWL